MEFLTWIYISISLFHSALFSGLNLGFFGSSRLRLEVKAEMNDPDAVRILSLRKDVHFLLATLLWGNVASNVLLTLFTESIMSGLAAFFFSSIGITIIGEIVPQAYLSKHALKSSIFLVPIIRFYQIVLYPLAKPSGLILDKWLGKEKIRYFNEDEVLILLRQHSQSEGSDISHFESMGAANFLALDDIKIKDEGEVVNPKSIIALPTGGKGMPEFPKVTGTPQDKFLQKIHASGEKWVVITNKAKKPLLILNADQFLRDAMYPHKAKSIYAYCHRPIVNRNQNTTLGEAIVNFKVRAENPEDDVVDNDILLYWGKNQKRIITGADILGRLLRGIVRHEKID